MVARYREALEGLGVRAEEVYLFGSYEGGNPREGSDIDLVVVSADFEGLSYMEREGVLGKAARRIRKPIEARGFTAREITDGDISTFWKHILANEAVPVWLAEEPGLAHALTITEEDMRKDTENWIAGSEYDLGTARDMLESGRYPYTVFMCHLAIEKMLKAHVAEVTRAVPPRTRGLMELAEKAELEVPPNLRGFISDVNKKSVSTRYPEDVGRLLADITREEAERYLRSTEEVLEWLKSHGNLKK